MNDDTVDRASSLEKARAGVASRLRARSAEIEQAIYARIHDAVPSPNNDNDLQYQAAVHATIAAVVSYSIDGIERGPEWLGPVPEVAAGHARRAVRAGVSLGTLLRRCVAGHRRLGEFVAEEAERSGLSSQGPALWHLRRTQEALLEALTAAMEREYNDECAQTARSPEQRRTDLVRRLLADEPVDPRELTELNYDLYASWHVGVIATGMRAKEVLVRLKDGLGCQLLPVLGGDATILGWLGSRRRLAIMDIERLIVDIERLSTNMLVGVSLAIGEPGRGIDGWRLTHHQSYAAFGIAVRKPQRLTRYVDILLLAATLQDDMLAKSLRTMYLEPLGAQIDRRGRERRQTLRAYIDAQCNITSAAFPLGVDRHTVENRVRAIEQLLGRPLRTCLAELDVALRIEELDDAAASPGSVLQTVAAASADTGQ